MELIGISSFQIDSFGPRLQVYGLCLIDVNVVVLLNGNIVSIQPFSVRPNVQVVISSLKELDGIVGSCGGIYI